MMPLKIKITGPLLALGLVVAMTASAEPMLKGSNPADGATLSAPPEQVVLEFAKPVALAGLTIYEASGAAHAVASLPRERGDHLVVKVPKLTSGSYTIEWRALSDTTHATTGKFSFQVK